MEALRVENISYAVHYPVPLIKQPTITNLVNPERCPISEEISRRIFSLPMYPELTDEELEKILEDLEKVAT